MKPALIFAIVALLFVSCGMRPVKPIDESFQNIVSVVRETGFRYEDYRVWDFGKSSYYRIEHKGNDYIARMPIVVDTLISLNMLPDSLTMEQNRGKDMAQRISTHCKEAEEIKDICLLFRTIWQTNPTELYLNELRINQEGNVTVYLKAKSIKKYFIVFITPHNAEVVLSEM